MMKKNHKILLSLLFLLTSTVQAQNVLSLSDAIIMGLENNYDLKITRKYEEISGINNTWGNTSLMPSLNFNANLRENVNFNDVDQYREQTISPDLSLNWVFFNGFSAKINKAKFELLEEQSQGNTAILIESTIQDIILAYNNCLLQKELMSVYSELAKLSESRYSREEDSKTLGTSTSYASLQAKTSWLEDQSNFLQQKVAYENAVRTLNFSLGVADDLTWNFSSKLTIDTKEYRINDLSEKLISNNLTLKNQYLYQSLLAKETRLTKSNFYPSLSLNSGFNNSDYSKHYQGDSPSINQNSSNAYVGLTLSWNIFSGGTRKRSVEIAKINEEMAQVQTEQMTHSLNNQLLQIYSTYNVNKAILDLSKEQVAAARLNLDLSREKLQNGTINSFNYRDVQISYMNAALAQMRAYYNLIQSNTNLLRITGGIINEYAKTKE